FGVDIRSLIGQRVTTLFCDGSPTESAALLRQLTRERVSVRLCGGEGFAPDRHHRETRVLLEGVVYVAEDWNLVAADQAALDKVLEPQGAAPASPAHVRGYLA